MHQFADTAVLQRRLLEVVHRRLVLVAWPEDLQRQTGGTIRYALQDAALCMYIDLQAEAALA